MISINEILVIAASITLLCAVYFSFKLSRETRHEKYWILLSLGLLIFAVHHWLMIPSLWGDISPETIELVENITSIISGVLIAYSTYGLYTSIRKINEKTK